MEAVMNTVYGLYTSLGIVMAPIAAITVGPFIDGFGRKKGLQFFYFISFLGFGVISFSSKVYQICIGRLICGAASGLYLCSIVYLVEICNKKQREYLFSVTAGIFSGGVTLATIIGACLPWQVACFIFCLVALVLFIAQCFIPESPPWLFKQGKEDASIRSLRSLGRSESAIRQEIDMLKLSGKDITEKVEFRTFLEPTVWKPFIIMVIFFFFQSASGINDLLYYSVDFIGRLGTTYDPLVIAVMLSTARFLASSTLAVIFRSKIGRRFATAFSGFWMAVALVAAGVYEYVYRDVRVPDRPLQWLLLVFLLVYMLASVLGLLCLPWLMSGEVYPLKVRGTMTGATHLAGFVFMFTSVNIYYICLDTLQIYGLLFAFAGFSFIAIFFGIFVLPETQNKSLHEIEQSFLPKKQEVITEKYSYTTDYQ